jgi:circadian clock protein KaiC
MDQREKDVPKMATVRGLRRKRREASETITKAPTGVIGLDEALRGGLPRGRTTIVFGGPGCGKTIFGLQSLVNGARRCHEPGIFVAFEEESRQIVANAASFGWDLPSLQRRQLFFLDAHLRPTVVQAGKFDLTAVLEALSVKVKHLGARRLVFDGIDVLLTLLDDPAAERTELYRIHEWLLSHELTGILTAKTMGIDPFSQPHYGFAAYMADCALLLARRHVDVVSEREVSVLKYRGSGFSENKVPFVIGPAGIEVAELHSDVDPVRPTTERLSSGVPRLDTMLKGGYFRAATVLITGLPGTAKSTLSGAFIHAACQRGERALYVSFDEHGSETVRNLASIAIQIQPFIDDGLLEMQSALSLTDSAEVQLMKIRAGIREHGAQCVVIDPISAISKSSNLSTALGVLARFIHWAKVKGITVVCTSLLSGTDPHREATELGVSTLSDTWIHLSYAQHGGERNRALTIIKSRGTGHSNQVRELILSDDGITLADVYEAGGEVFMGAMRWERENLHRDQERRLKAEALERRLQLERNQAELEARRQLLQREVDINRLELDEAKLAEAERLERESRRHYELLRQRGADAEVLHSNGAPLSRRRPARKGRPT